MTPNPFDDLDRQLRRAVEARRRGRRRVSRRALIAVAVALTLSGGVAAAATLLSQDGDEAAARRAVDDGTSAARKLAVCAAASPSSHRAVTEISGPPNRAVLSQLGVFRRPRTGQDRLPVALHVASRGMGSVLLKDTVRAPRTADGTRFVLFIMRGAKGQLDPVGCARAAQSQALKAAAHLNENIRERVQATTSKRVALVTSIASGTTDELNFMELSSNGHIVGGSGTHITRGMIPAITRGGIGRWTRSISGVVGDGVTTVRAIDRSGPPRQRVPPITSPVSDNVYHVTAPRRMGPRITLEWRNAAGTVERRVHLRASAAPPG